MGPFCPHRQSGGRCRTRRNRVRQVGLGAAANTACACRVCICRFPLGAKRHSSHWTQSPWREVQTSLDTKHRTRSHALGPPRRLHTSVLLTAWRRGALGPDLTPCAQLPGQDLPPSPNGQELPGEEIRFLLQSAKSSGSAHCIYKLGREALFKEISGFSDFANSSMSRPRPRTACGTKRAGRRQASQTTSLWSGALGKHP